MKLRSLTAATLLAGATAILLAVTGCGPSGSQGDAGKTGEAKTPASGAVADDSDGWWCPEHGIPEEECSMCSAKAAAAFKKKGDWCDKHNRARSQCFLCEPELKEKYAALYRNRYQKEPPPIEE